MSGPTLATVSLLGPEVSHSLWLPQPGQACHTPTHGRLGGEGALPLLALSPCAGHEQKRQSPPLSPGPHASQAPASWPALQLEAVSRMHWAFYQGQCRDYSASQRADILSWPHPQPPSQTHCSTAGSGWGLLAPWRGPPLEWACSPLVVVGRRPPKHTHPVLSHPTWRHLPLQKIPPVSGLCH